MDLTKFGNKDLEEYSLEELWQLFPVELVAYNPDWLKWADDEINYLKNLLSDINPEISHIGSTSIIGICAKNIVDILIETPDSDNWNVIVGRMESNGYLIMSREKHRMSFNKGYTINGYAEKVFHIHFHISGDRDEIMFRDYLNQNPSVAREYEKLKLSLLPEFRNDRDGYTRAKTDFVRKILQIVKNDDSSSAEITEEAQITVMLYQKLGKRQVLDISEWSSISDRNRDFLWRMSLHGNRRVSVNSLWIMTHLDILSSGWLDFLQGALIIRLLAEEDSSKKRIFLQLLRNCEFDPDRPLTIKLLDFCFSKINSECEPYAVRCFSIYVAFKICRDYPELIAELEEYLELLSTQALSPGLKSGLRQTKHKISRLNFSKNDI